MLEGTENKVIGMEGPWDLPAESSLADVERVASAKPKWECVGR